MSGAPIINGLMIFFSVTTVAAMAYPLFKLLPSWLERRVHRQIAFHSDALAALDGALVRSHNDHEHKARLAAQRAYHFNALIALAPDDARNVAAAPVIIDAAA
jgi:hypothetical protein